MKKSKIYSIIISILCFSLLFLPIQYGGKNATWVSVISCFFLSMKAGWTFNLECLRETLIAFLGTVTIISCIIAATKPTKITNIVKTACASFYIVLWTIATYIPLHSSQIPIRDALKIGTSQIWYYLELFVLLALIVLLVLQYLPSRRPTKAARLQAQVDDLQKQIDELKKGE